MDDNTDDSSINRKQEAQTMAISKKTLNHAQEFFTRVSALNDKLAVSQAVNELLDQLKAEYTIKTISVNLSEYRKPFREFTHENPDLNETINTKKGVHTQHCAVSMLNLNEEQQAELIEKRRETSHARDGFDKDGEIRELDLPKTDIAKIIEKSCECLLSDNPLIIAAGIVNLTGLRANEQNMPRYNHKDLGIIERQMIVLDEFVIGFKGVSKKHNEDDILAFYARPTLAPAKLIVDAHNKYLSFRAVQAISTDINTYQKTFQQQFKNEYKKIFGKTLSTIEMFDDDGELTRENGTPHKGRAFYACALRAILKQKYFGSSAINTYVQLALVHDSIAETMKYLGRYDEALFINPININLPTNIKGLGKRMDINQTVEIVENKLDKNFNLSQFIEGLSVDNQLKIAEFLNDGMGETKAVLALFEYATANKKSSATVTENVVYESADNQASTRKETVTDTIAQIVENIMHYNRQSADGEIEKIAVPTYGLINKICERIQNKSLASTTVKTYLTKQADKLNEELEKMGVSGGINNTSHNGQYHRKTMSELVDTILEYS
jgi:hypothetical protein